MKDSIYGKGRPTLWNHMPTKNIPILRV